MFSLVQPIKEKIYLNNLYNKQLLILNCGHDRLYPLYAVRPFINVLKKIGVSLTFVEKPFFGHTLKWWNEEENRIQKFIQQIKRDPLPVKLKWETDQPERNGRCHWLIIKKLGNVKNETLLNPWNKVLFGNLQLPPGLEFAFKVDINESDKVVNLNNKKIYTGPGLKVTKVIKRTFAEDAGLKIGDGSFESQKQKYY